MAALRALLAAGADLHACAEDGKSLLHYAALGGSAPVVKALVAADAVGRLGLATHGGAS
jgi:ankyrin repeat protein